MSFKVKTNDLLGALQKTIKVVPTRSTLPILGCALFEFNDREMTIKATNLETSIIEKISFNGEGPNNPIAIPIGRFLEIISNISEKETNLSINEKGQLKIETKTGSYLIMGQECSEFPSDPIMKETQSIYIDTASLFEIIDFTKNSTSKDELKPALQGVLFKIDNSRIIGVATDGHRLSRIIKETTENNQEKEIIIPTKFLSLLIGFVEKNESVEIEISKNHLSLSYKNTTIYSRIIQDTYPDYEKVIPIDNEKTLITNKASLASAIKRVSIFSNRLTKQITFNISSKELTISTEDSENAAQGKEVLSCDFNSTEDLKIGFNSTFLLEALGNVENENMGMFLSGPLNAAVIAEKSKDKKTDKLILLMPIRLND